MSAKLFFLKEFFRDPRAVGSVIPTSRAAIDALLDPVDWSRVRTVVEYGPGTGVFTREILSRIRPSARLVAIDTNRVFIDYLRDVIADDRLVCVHGSAADVEAILARCGEHAADYVISGLPFSTLPGAITDAIMDSTCRAIRPGGAFLVYQYSLFVMPMLEARFDRVQLGRVWRCTPPARLFWAHRSMASAFSLDDAESLAAE
ncbi:class I SAM-dependent methyltransferase [Sphingobium nicotianae]|uniref:class I SAM-dependent methyltransferase n=1 Tax=Sphingobium nicotianae TaxID=2782607 RepID=UPI0032D8F87F